MVNLKGDLVSWRTQKIFFLTHKHPHHGAALVCQMVHWVIWLHMINAALALMGPIQSLMCEYETVHEKRPGGHVSNDDHAQIMCRFDSGAMGHMYFSRVATGRKMICLRNPWNQRIYSFRSRRSEFSMVISIRRTRS